MRYVSLFSGIEAASVAWKPLGWEPMAFSEIELFPCRVLAERFPSVPNLGDICDVDWEEFVENHGRPNVIVGGSPCQSFSVAGGRESLDGQSRLCFEYVRAIREIKPSWLVWENVPGVLNTRDNAFGRFMCALWDGGYHDLSWRVLDAQFFGVAQRRRRVFVVGHLGDGMRSAAVLFERESVRGHNPSSREKRQELAASAGRGAAGGGCFGFSYKSSPGAGSIGYDREIAPSLLTARNDASVLCVADDNAVYQPAVLPFDTTQVTSPQNGNNPRWGDPCHPLCAAGHVPTVCVASTQVHSEVDEKLCGTLTRRMYKDATVLCVADDNANAAIDVDMSETIKCGGSAPIVASPYVVRRLTPLECERLQGFPDGYTDLGDGKDAPRYKALGNSMAVPVMRWIGERIKAVDGMKTESML